MANAWARLRLSVAERAAVWVWFPRALGTLHVPDRYELACALEEIARDVRDGKLNGSSSIAVPHTRRMRMKAEMDGKGPDGFGWRFMFEWDKLGAYAPDVAQTAESFASRVNNTPGSATSGDPTYVVTFKLTGAEQDVARRPGGKIEAKAGDLQYSEMVALQDEGLALLQQLNVPAHNEIKSGQRK